MEMEYRQLGRTGVQVSPLCLGCMMFGGKTGPEDSYAIIDRAIDAGVNFLDTANVYSRGRSEEVTGAALKRNGKRQQVVLATKVHGTMDDDDPNAQGNSRRHIIEQCDASLRRLQTDYIDLYQIHRPRPEIAIDETLRALDDLVRAGKVRYTGTSTFAAWQLVESLWASKDLGLNRFICEQPPYNLLDRRIERELLPMAQTFGLAIIPWSPIAAEKGCTLAQLALAWVAERPGVTSPIIGPRTMEQLEDNLGALKVTFTDDDRANFDAIVPPGRMVSPFYDANFGPSIYRW